jgi:alkylated DNA repair dioxygenase AlkB
MINLNVTLPHISGLSCFHNYISLEEEQNLLAAIDRESWLSDLRRRVQHYGYRYDYKARAVNADMYLGALPSWVQPLTERFCAEGWLTVPPDQLIVNEYQPGQGISPHIDCVPCFGATILSLSLGTPIVMLFSHVATGEQHQILLEPRSLLLMQGSARYDWKHSIPARKTDEYAGQIISRGRRISLTFRNIIKN